MFLNTLFKIIYLEGKFCSSIQYCWTEPQAPVVNKYVGLCPVLCFSISIVLSSLHNWHNFLKYFRCSKFSEVTHCKLPSEHVLIPWLLNWIIWMFTIFAGSNPSHLKRWDSQWKSPKFLLLEMWLFVSCTPSMTTCLPCPSHFTLSSKWNLQKWW